MIVRVGFASIIVQADDQWEVWTVWCLEHTLTCHRERFATADACRELQDRLTAVASEHEQDEVDRSSGLESAALVRPGSKVVVFFEPQSAIQYFVDGRHEEYLRLASRVVAMQVNDTCSAL